MGWLSLLMCALCLCCLSVQESLDIYTLSLHDALPISCWSWDPPNSFVGLWTFVAGQGTREHGLSRTQKGGSKISRYRKDWAAEDRKSTRLNSSHRCISYAVFCLKKKNNTRGGRDATSI